MGEDGDWTGVLASRALSIALALVGSEGRDGGLQVRPFGASQVVVDVGAPRRAAAACRTHAEGPLPRASQMGRRGGRARQVAVRGALVRLREGSCNRSNDGESRIEDHSI